MFRVGRGLAGTIFALPAMWSCAPLQGGYEVQAPYDSYVCFDASFLQCLESAQVRHEYSLLRHAYGRVFVDGTVKIRDPGANTVTISTDKKYQCRNSNVPYTQSIRQSELASVVFIPPALLNQIGEQMVQLDRLRRNCLRTMQAYNYQQKILPTQDAESAAQKSVQYLSALVENENISPNASVNLTLSSTQITQYGLAPPPAGQNLKLADALLAERNLSTQSADTLRTQAETQAINVQYKQQFDDAQLAIDAQLRQLGSTLQALDGAVVMLPKAEAGQQYYTNGSWVQKGSVVLNLGKRPI
jgi:hypothetical protein